MSCNHSGTAVACGFRCTTRDDRAPPRSHNFGRAYGPDLNKLRRLAARVLRVCGEEQTRVDGAGAVPGKLKVRDAWFFSAAHILEQLWRELGIDAVLARCADAKHERVPVERALFAMVANRALGLYSKLYCWEQWLRDVFLPSADELELQHLYRAMDFIEDHKDEVEKEVYFRTADLMNADVDVIFYDTTSLHCEIDDEDDAEIGRAGRAYPALRKRGYVSRRGRSNAPQNIVGLAVTRDRLPVRSWVVPGQTICITTVEKVMEDLRGWRLGRCVLVGVAGQAAAEEHAHDDGVACASRAARSAAG